MQNGIVSLSMFINN